MLRKITAYVGRHHIALLALFFALGGTAFAAGNALLPKNSVGTAQLKKGAVTKQKIASKTLAQLKGNKGAQGAPGAAGPQGPQGVQGPPGAPNPNADTLNGYAANQLARVARAHNSFTLTTGSVTTISSVALTVPRSGFVVVTAATDANAGSAGCTCQLATHVSDGSAESWNVNTQVPTSGEVGTANTYVFPVTVSAPTVKAFTLAGWRFSGTGNVNTWSDLTAIFVPFGSSGGSTLAPTGRTMPQPQHAG